MTEQQQPPEKKRGRPAKGDRAMTNAERQAQHRAKAKTSQPAVLAKREGRDNGYYQFRHHLYDLKEFIRGAESMAIAMKAYLKNPDDKERVRQLERAFTRHGDRYHRAMSAIDNIVDSFEWPEDWETQHGVRNLKTWHIFDHSQIK
ncbi:hypothetical protein [Brucella intermedia]|uniref:hypothetical protein n=1 Tax=Brucella intermedia TaxID=94625 RepID=UPI00244E964E|nr:hypothetical protein [Brucella intermedia]WGJ06626.1 hypothetical protein QBQ48_12310 [Brucella intermedia]